MLRSSAINIFSNGILSASTFLVGIMFLRNDLMIEYSQFIYLGTIVLLMQGALHSSFTTCFLSKINEKNIQHVLGNTILAILILTIIIQIIFTNKYLILISSALLLGYHDFNKNFYISINNMRKIFFADTLLSFSRCIVVYLYVNYFIHQYNNIEILFLIFSIPSFFYYLTFHFINQAGCKNYKILSILTLIRETKWSTGENVIHGVYANLHIFVLNSLLGPTSLAIYAAINSIFSMYNLFFSGLSQFYLPKLRLLYTRNDKTFSVECFSLLKYMMIFSIVTIVLTLTFQKNIFSIIFTKELFDIAEPFTYIFAIYFIFRIINMYQLVIKKSRNEYKSIFVVKLVISILLLVSMPTLTSILPTIYSILIIQIIAATLTSYLLYRIK